MADDIAETWSIHSRINLYLLGAIPPEVLSASLGKGARTVVQLFSHIHNVRLMWLKSAAPELLAGLDKLTDVATKDDLSTALEASGRAMESLLRKSVAEGGRIKGFKPHVVAFLGYLISHESHHRGQIGWTLKLTGHPLDRRTAYGLWEWGVR
jgi:uncharacterized damage-inducible protein DinB